jgi:DNA-binding Xre family transcriptional regulator
MAIWSIVVILPGVAIRDSLYSMRLRLPELLARRKMTAYQLAKLSEGRISLSTLYRVLRADGYANSYESKFLDAICDVLEAEPKELFEKDGPQKRKGSR